MVRHFYLEYSSINVDRGGIWKGDILVADTEELDNFRRVKNPCSETQCERWVNISHSRSQMEHSNSLANVLGTRATQCGQSFHLSQCMRCRDDPESGPRTRKTTGACQRTSARQALGQTHHKACLKHPNSSTDQNSLIDQLLCSWNIMAKAR